MRVNVVVCRGPTCGDKRGSAALSEHLRASVAARGLADRVELSEEICLGHCLRGPNVLVCDAEDPDGVASPRAVLYNRMTAADLDRVVDRHLVGGIAIRALTNLPPVVQAHVCDAHLMPQALVTQDNFWNSSARAHLVGFLGLQTPCKP